jgi:hypothetical protein
MAELLPRRRRGKRDVILVAYRAQCPTSAWVAAEWLAALGSFGDVAMGRDVACAASMRSAFEGTAFEPPAPPRLDWGIMTGMQQLMLHMPVRACVGVGMPPENWEILRRAWAWPDGAWSAWSWAMMPERSPSGRWASDAWELGRSSALWVPRPTSVQRSTLPWAAPAWCLDRERGGTEPLVWSLDAPRSQREQREALRPLIEKRAGWQEVWERLAPQESLAWGPRPTSWPRDTSTLSRQAWALLQDWTLAREALAGSLLLISPERAVSSAWNVMGVPCGYIPCACIRDALSHVTVLVSLGDPAQEWSPGPWEWAAAASGCVCFWGGQRGEAWGEWDLASFKWVPDQWASGLPSLSSLDVCGLHAREVVFQGHTWEHRVKVWRALRS